MKTGIAILMSTLYACGCIAKDMPLEQTQLVILLKHEMTSNVNWVGIHAGDALIEHGEFEAVENFLQQGAKYPRVGQLRLAIGAETDLKKRDKKIQELVQIAKDPASPDRLNAIESLAKLSVNLDEHLEPFEKWLSEAEDQASPYLHWALSHTAQLERRHKHLAALSRLLTHAEPLARMRAAYALARIQSIGASEIKQLELQAEKESPDSMARVYLISAAFLHADPHGQSILQWRKRLRDYVVKGRVNEQFEASAALAKRSDDQDRELLKQLLTSQDADARIGAANALMHLLK